MRELKNADVLGFVTHFVHTVSPLLSNTLFQTYSITQAMLNTIINTAIECNNSIDKTSLAGSKSSYVSAAIYEVLKAIRSNIV